jgi:uncharacterized protein (TIGR00369 family)
MSQSLSLLEKELEEFKRGAGSGMPFPPPCFMSMKGEFMEYESRNSLTVDFPVLKESLNPQSKMQGGFVAAAFDNVFGPLSYLSARGPCTTLDLHTQFIRGIDAGDRLRIVAKIIARGTSTIFITAEAFNSANRLIATSSTNLLIARS